jgi:AraC-like DNA-binding protein
MHVLATCSHSPSGVARRVFNVVLQSGHFRAQPGCRLERRDLPGHQLLYLLEGSGYVLCNGTRFRMQRSDVVWLSGSTRCVAEREFLEVLWMCVEGHQVDEASGVLAVQDRPVFGRLPREETRQLFERVNALLTNPRPAADTVLNRKVAQLLGYLVESREVAKLLIDRASEDDYPELRSAFVEIASNSQRSWKAAELARLCGLSERHFFRRFKQATGLSPINWLKMQRITLAQSKLLQSGHSIKQIADQVGYNDVFFFSRDFKRHTGTCPSQYRRERSGLANREAPEALA